MWVVKILHHKNLAWISVSISVFAMGVVCLRPDLLWSFWLRAFQKYSISLQHRPPQIVTAFKIGLSWHRVKFELRTWTVVFFAFCRQMRLERQKISRLWKGGCNFYFFLFRWCTSGGAHVLIKAWISLAFAQKIVYHRWQAYQTNCCKRCLTALLTFKASLAPWAATGPHAIKTCRSAVLYALVFASGVILEFGPFDLLWIKSLSPSLACQRLL